MIKNILLIVVFASFLLSSCNKPNKSNILRAMFKGYEKVITNPDSVREIKPDIQDMLTINIPSNTKNAVIDLGNIIDSIYYVKLETTGSCLIGNIDEIIFCKDRIIVVEKYRRSMAYIFSNNGKFIAQIGKIGKGPGEYTEISAIAVDNIKNEIALFDGHGLKIMYFDLNGKLKNSKRIYYFITDFAILNDGSYLFNQLRNSNSHLPSISNYNLFFAKSNQNVIGKTLSYSYRDKYPNNDIGSITNFNCTSSSVLFTPMLSDTVYEIDHKNGIKAKYNINIGKNDILNNLSKDVSTDGYTKACNIPKNLTFDGFTTQTTNYFYFQIFHSGYYYFNKKSHTLIGGNSYRFSTKTNNKIIMAKEPITAYNSFFVSIIWPYEFVDNLKGYRLLDSKVAAMLKDVTKDDNPVLCFYSLKDK